MNVRVSELTDARDIARRELRSPRILLHWIIQQPRHRLELYRLTRQNRSSKRS